MTFAALPVGANSTALNPNLGMTLINELMRVVFPVPAYPFSKKQSRRFSSSKNSAIFRKKCSCPAVGSCGKLFLSKSEGVGGDVSFMYPKLRQEYKIHNPKKLFLTRSCHNRRKKAILMPITLLKLGMNDT